MADDELKNERGEAVPSRIHDVVTQAEVAPRGLPADAEALQRQSKLQAKIDELEMQLRVQQLQNQLAQGAPGPRAKTESHHHKCVNCGYEFFYPVPVNEQPETYVQNNTAGCPSCCSTAGHTVTTHRALLAAQEN